MFELMYNIIDNGSNLIDITVYFYIGHRIIVYDCILLLTTSSVDIPIFFAILVYFWLVFADIVIVPAKCFDPLPQLLQALFCSLFNTILHFPQTHYKLFHPSVVLHHCS